MEIVKNNEDTSTKPFSKGDKVVVSHNGRFEAGTVKSILNRFSDWKSEADSVYTITVDSGEEIVVRDPSSLAHFLNNLSFPANIDQIIDEEDSGAMQEDLIPEPNEADLEAVATKDIEKVDLIDASALGLVTKAAKDTGETETGETALSVYPDIGSVVNHEGENFVVLSIINLTDGGYMVKGYPLNSIRILDQFIF